MRLTKLFTKTSKNVPADETSKNARLLIQAGLVHKVMAGVYAYTPLGLRVIENIKRIVREEMDAVDGQELIMTNLQPKEHWDITKRWDDEVVDIWFKTQLKDGTPVGLAWSHEEAIIEMMRQYVSSYKDLPISVYQFQTKLRNELRAKSGIMRGREFVMKDMYSICIDSDQHDAYYGSVMDAYLRVYDRIGLGKDTYVTYASGGAFTKFSHEFQTICDAGEDTIYLHRGKNIAINEEVLDDESLQKLGIRREELEEVKSSEVGNIFNFGTEKSEQTDFGFTNKDGERQYVHLGSYGIGITRLMGVVVEKFADERGIIWPEAIAPALIYLARLGDDESVVKAADILYESLTSTGVLVIYDDRDLRAGEKFADADLMGIPYRVVVSPKTIGQTQVEDSNSAQGVSNSQDVKDVSSGNSSSMGNKVEVKSRRGSQTALITQTELLKRVQSDSLAELFAQDQTENNPAANDRNKEIKHMSMKKHYRLTQDGVDELQSELTGLVAERRDIADKIKTAREFGDLAENFEYSSARQEQEKNESRISELEAILQNVEVIQHPKSDGKVVLGSTVKMKNGNGPSEATKQFQVVGTVEADPLNGKISDESPIGQSLLGKKVGDSVEIKTPTATTSYSIVEIS